MALDRKVGNGERFSDHPSYQKLVENLGIDNNIFVAISPTIAAKNSAADNWENGPGQCRNANYCGTLHESAGKL